MLAFSRKGFRGSLKWSKFSLSLEGKVSWLEDLFKLAGKVCSIHLGESRKAK